MIPLSGPSKARNFNEVACEHVIVRLTAHHATSGAKEDVVIFSEDGIREMTLVR
jgi:hypothetical protein